MKELFCSHTSPALSLLSLRCCPPPTFSQFSIVKPADPGFGLWETSPPPHFLIAFFSHQQGKQWSSFVVSPTARKWQRRWKKEKSQRVAHFERKVPLLLLSPSFFFTDHEGSLSDDFILNAVAFSGSLVLEWITEARTLAKPFHRDLLHIALENPHLDSLKFVHTGPFGGNDWKRANSSSLECFLCILDHIPPSLRASTSDLLEFAVKSYSLLILEYLLARGEALKGVRLSGHGMRWLFKYWSKQKKA